MDKVEVEHCIEQYAEMIWRISLIHCTGRKEDAEDVFQETFLALVKSHRAFHGEEHLKAWLIRVAMNQCKKKYRSNAGYQLVEPEKMEMLLESTGGEQQTGQDGSFELLCGLADKYRRVMELFYVEEIPSREIAQILRISESAVRKRLQRGREMLRQKGFEYGRES